MGQTNSSEQSQGEQPECLDSNEAPVSPDSPTGSLQTGALAEKEAVGKAMTTATSHGSCMLRWTGSSLPSLVQAESKLLGSLGLRIFDTDIGEGQHIHTIEGGNGKSAVPLVLCHGYAMGVGGWYRNLGELAEHTHVFAKDWLGWGLSSRPMWKEKGVPQTEEFFVQSMERWRKANNVEKMVLCGHSLGGYLSVCYAERYPERIDKLLLVSPVGFPEEPDRLMEAIEERPFHQRSMIKVIKWGWNKGITPGDLVRSFGPVGYRMMHGYSSQRFTSPDVDRQALGDYLYHNLACTRGSGERALSQLLKPGAWAYSPLWRRLPHLDHSIPIHFIFGDRDWMSPSIPEQLKAEADEADSGQSITVTVLQEAGHQLFLDNSQAFNAEVLKLCGVNVEASDNDIAS